MGDAHNVKTATHRIKKRFLAFLLTAALLATMIPGVFAVDLSVDAGFYFKQSRGGTCTLVSAAMMLRRRAYLDGMTDWTDVTENSVRSSAWSGGLSHNFVYKAMRVAYATLPSGTKAKTDMLIQLLAEHPEGIVLYDRTEPHAVLLTDYTDGVFYCSDPAGSVSSGRVPISSASISIGRSSCYWYIASDENGTVEQSADTLRLESVRYPVNIKVGSGMGLTGVVSSASDNILISVEVAVLDAANQTVQSAEAAPNASSYSLKGLDSQIRFGELAQGSYTYMVVLTDGSGQSMCFVSDFTVSDADMNTSTYWSAQDPDGTKLSQGVETASPDTAADVQTTTDDAATEPEQYTGDDLWSWLDGLWG